jgi:DNA-binding response OmpR family regulator
MKQKRPLRILYVGKRPGASRSIRGALREAGHEVHSVFPGRAGLRYLSGGFRDYDILVIEFRLNGLPGLELVRRIRAVRFRGRILVHGRGLQPSDVVRLRAMKVDAILRRLLRPEGVADLVAMVWYF